MDFIHINICVDYTKEKQTKAIKQRNQLQVVNFLKLCTFVGLIKLILLEKEDIFSSLLTII